MRQLSFWAAALLLFRADPASADRWPAPQVREAFSDSRDHFVRVIPGKSWGDTIGFSGSAQGAYATAEFYRRQDDRSYRLMHKATLLNPVVLVEFFVSDEGRLATLDNWHNRGYGQAVAVYDAEGKLVQAYALADLFSPAEIEALPHSISSIDWHAGAAYIRQDQRTLYIQTQNGGGFVIGLETGRYSYCETRGGKFLCRNGNAERRWAPYTATVER